RVLPVSRFHSEPHPMLSLFAFHFCPPPFAGNSAEQTVQTPIVSGFCSDPAWQPSPSEECTFTAILRQLLTFVKVRSRTPGTEAVWGTRRATFYGPDRKGKSPTVNTGGP